MLYFDLLITNPYSTTLRMIACRSGRLTEYKQWELQIFRDTTIIGMSIRATVRGDHTGTTFGLGFLGHSVEVGIYDIRHESER